MKPTNTFAKLFSSVSTLAIFALHSLALANGGTVVGWGSGSGAQVPFDLGPCTQISAGIDFTLAIKENGTVAAWGANNCGSTTVPANLGVCKAIAAGGYHSIAIQANGTVVCWGAGKTISNQAFEYGQSIIPSDLGPCIQIAAGLYHSMALQTNGLVRVWGLAPSTVPANLGPCIEIEAGGRDRLAIKTDGNVQVWGFNEVVPTTLGTCKAIASGNDYDWWHTVAIKTNGTVVCWGTGLTNTGSNYQYGQSIVPAGLGPCVKISAGDFHTLALRTDGIVKAWGWNIGGQCTVPTTLGPCVQISAGSMHSVAIQGEIPKISGVLPISGPSTGGTSITITGTNFQSLATVTIGGTPATNVMVVSDTQITATTPAGFPGPAVVTVNLGSSTAFYYRPTCGSDLDNSGVVDSGDISIVLLDFGSCSESSAVAQQQEPPILQTAEPVKPFAVKK